VGRELPRLVQVLTEAGADPVVLATEHPGHATELARRAATEGAETVVAVGGDGTVNEVVNGLIKDDRLVGRAVLGVVSAGSGADFARTFALPGHANGGVRGIVGPATPIDVVRLTFETPEGTATRYFVNIAEAGMGAATVVAADRLPRRLGKARYLVAFWPTLVRFDPAEVTVTVDEESVTATAHNVIVANGGYFGGGMNISPKSQPDDGVVEVQVNIGPKRQALTLIPKIFKGRHLPDDRIIEMAGRRGSVETEEPMPVEADGEILGTTPMRFEVLSGLLQMRT
jgi:YegS/Rv2252/BmrU family lipid kinase